MPKLGLMIDVTTNDLAVVNSTDNDGKIGGLIVGDCTYQNQYMLLKASKGEFKEFPTVGIGIDGIINDDEMRSWKALIIEEFKKEGLTVKNLDINSGGQINIDANY